MKVRSGHIFALVLAVCCAFGLGSCIYDHYADVEVPGTGGGSDYEDSGKGLLVLRISPLNATTSGGENNGVEEKIKSLRIVMMQNNESERKTNNTEAPKDTIEYNGLISFGSGNGISVSGFSHTFTCRATPGEKKFYLIANEESVGQISFSATVSLPQDLGESPTLTALLDAYKGTDAQDKGKDLEAALEAVTFSRSLPVYAKAGETGEVFLPYTAFYGGPQFSVEAKSENGGETVLPKETVLPAIYLVPVATKFVFNFYNYRLNEVTINNLAVEPINSENYLMAKVGETDYYKDFDDKEKDLYWIDWLKRVANATHSSDPNLANETYGWILDYEVPSSDAGEKVTLLPSAVESPSVTVPKGEDKNTEDPNDITPGVLHLGPYYFPECKSSKQDQETAQGGNTGMESLGQTYLFFLALMDNGNGIELEGMPIESVKALFRNTSVIINVTMKEGEVEAFAEIADWNQKSANGWVTEGGKPKDI